VSWVVLAVQPTVFQGSLDQSAHSPVKSRARPSPS
jgi:hypothetical protein